MKAYRAACIWFLSTGIGATAAIAQEDERATDEPWRDTVDYNQYLAGADLRASDLVGAGVYNRAGESLGEIEDLIISRDDQVVLAVLSVGGFLDIGDKLVAVPYEELRVSTRDERLYLDATQESLEAEPAFDYGEPVRTAEREDVASGQNRGAPGGEERVDRTEGQANRLEAQDRSNEPAGEPARRPDPLRERSAEPAQGRDAGETATLDTREEVEQRAAERSATAEQRRASTLIGEAIVSSEGERVGRIDDIVFEPETGNVQAVISLDTGDGRRVIVPVQRLDLASSGAAGTEESENESARETEVRSETGADSTETGIRIDMTAEELRAAREFEGGADAERAAAARSAELR